MKKSKTFKITIYIVVIHICIFNALPVKAVPIPAGTPVYDFTAVTQFADEVKNSGELLKYSADMAEQVGKGNFTPSVISWLGGWYSKCGGKKFVLPDWFPHPNFNFCADAVNTDRAISKWYKEQFIVSKDDDGPTANRKSIQADNARQKTRLLLLTRSMKQLKDAANNQTTIQGLQDSIKDSKNEIEILKIQAQIQVLMLAELKDIRSNQALIMQSIGMKE